MAGRAPLTLILVSAALVGCAPAGEDSTEDFTGPQREVVATIEALQEAAASRDPQAMCSDLLASSVREALRASRTPCAEAVELQVPRGAVQLQDDRARVRVRVGRGEEDLEAVTFAMVREGRNWKLAGIEGATPPGDRLQG